MMVAETKAAMAIYLDLIQMASASNTSADLSVVLQGTLIETGYRIRDVVP